MIKKKGIITVHEGNVNYAELLDSVERLTKDGSYQFFIFDEAKNRSLPQLKYLFGTVLKTISENLPDHPPVDALYRYFEALYAPICNCHIQGKKFSYFDLKNVKSAEMDDVIEKVIHHATNQWGILIPTKEEIREAEATELYAEAYAEMWKNLPLKP